MLVLTQAAREIAPYCQIDLWEYLLEVRQDFILLVPHRAPAPLVGLRSLLVAPLRKHLFRLTAMTAQEHDDSEELDVTSRRVYPPFAQHHGTNAKAGPAVVWGPVARIFHC